jgi:RimJ/RimL family protein N-acetyltransferase
MMRKLLPNIPSQIETERLVVRKYENGDGQVLFLLLERNNNRDALRENVYEASTVQTVEDAEINIRKHSAEWDARDRFVMGIWVKNESRYVGEIWIEPKIWEVPSFEIGWFLDVGYQGKGIATEAVRRSIAFLFNDLNAHKVIAIIHDKNAKSCRLAERLGFRMEGHLRECGVENGKRYGVIYYGILKNEFHPIDGAD